MSIFSDEELKKALSTLPAEAPPTGASVVQQPKAPSAILPMLAAVAGNTADTLSTWKAISSGRGVESNPLLPKSPTKIAAMKGALTLPQILLIKKLNDSGHPTAAKVLGYGVGALGGLLAYNNSKVGR